MDWRYCSLIVLLSVAALGQQPIGWVDGHSAAGYQLQYVVRDFPGFSWQGNTHYSLDCQELYQLLPYDMELVQGTPSVAILWVGTTDAERLHDTDEFIQCVIGYLQTVQIKWPEIQIVLPNVTPFNVQTLLPPAGYPDTRSTVAQYNAALMQLNMQNVTVVDIYSSFISPEQCLPQGQQYCFSNGKLIPYIDIVTSQGWWLADGLMRNAVTQ